MKEYSIKKINQKYVASNTENCNERYIPDPINGGMEPLYKPITPWFLNTWINDRTILSFSNPCWACILVLIVSKGFLSINSSLILNVP